jgi:hypothetical protein
MQTFKKETTPTKIIITYKCAAIKIAFCFPKTNSEIQIVKKLKKGKNVKIDNISKP